MRFLLLSSLLFFSLAAYWKRDNIQTTPNTANIKKASTGVIFQSSDAGDTWQDISAGLSVQERVGNLSAPNERTLFISSEKGLYRYNPPPIVPTWQQDQTLVEGYFAMHPGKSGLYATSLENGLFQNVIGSSVWMPLAGDLKDKRLLSVLESQNGSLIVSSYSGLFKSDDHGKTWKHVFKEEIISDVYETDGVLVGVSFIGIVRSTDGGNHWEWVQKDYNKPKLTAQLDGKLAVFVHETDGWKKVSVGTTQNVGGCANTWQQLTEGLGAFRKVYHLEQMGKWLFCSYEGGIARSADQGKTWSPVFLTPDDQTVLWFVVSGQSIFMVKSFGC